MKTTKVLIFSALILLLGLGIFSCYYKTPIKRILLKKYQEIFENKHSPVKVSNKKEGDFIWGIDISHYQTKIDWDVLVKNNKPDFIFLKCTEGVTHQDTKYKLYKKKAEKYNILIGAYHFFSYQTSGEKQALNFIKNSSLTKGDLFPVLDIEYKRNRSNNKKIRKQVREFCKVIKNKYGVNPIIYCEYDYYQNILKSEFKNYNYWISDMYREPICEYGFWQYTDKGDVQGIGKIDNNIMKKGLDINDYLLKK